jgi:hypothetical protein
MHRLNIHKQRPFDTLFYPPGGISAEASPAVRVKVINGLYKADIALLYQVAKAHSPVRISFCDIDNQPQVAANQLFSGLRVVLLYNELAQMMLLLKRQQRRLIYLLQILFYGCVEYDGLFLLHSIFISKYASNADITGL